MGSNNEQMSFRNICQKFVTGLLCLTLVGCDLIQMKSESVDDGRKPVARANETFLYEDDLEGIINDNISKEDSTARVIAYVNSWIRKQLLIDEALKRIDIDEAEVERKMLDYRYSLIGYEYQNFYVKQNLNYNVSDNEILEYYQEHLDNFILKQNIVQGTYIKVPESAPRVNRLKDLIYATDQKEIDELRSYCLSFSTAYHLSDSSWIEFDKLVVNSPMAEIPNKIQFLRSYPFYETNDAGFHYFLKVDAYQISDNESPLEFVKEDIRNIILNKRKVELARELEEIVFENASEQRDFEIFDN